MSGEVKDWIKVRELTVTPLGDTAGLTVNNNAGGAADLITVTNYSTGNALYVEGKTALESGKYIARFWSNLANTNSSAIVAVEQHNGGSTQPALSILNDGTGSAQFIDMNGLTGNALEIDQDSNSDAADQYAIKIVSDNAGTKLGGGIDMSSFAAGEPLMNCPAGTASNIDPSATAETGWINIALSGTVVGIPYYALP